MKAIYLLIASIFIFTGCSQRVAVTSFKPAEVNEATNMKKISVLGFSNDRIGFASQLETELSKKTVNGQKYFTVLNRNEVNSIIDEQKFQHSGLVDKDTSVKLGKILGINGIISGDVLVADMNKSYYNTERYECLDKKCKEKRYYLVSCVRANYDLSVSIRLTDVEKGTIVYADTLSKGSYDTHCRDRSGGLSSFGSVMTDLTDDIVTSFMTKISPTKVRRSVELLDDPEIKYTDKQEQLLEYSLEHISDNRLDKAEQLLSELLGSTNDKCYVAAYNLGVVKETQGDYKLARQLYELADSLTIKPNKTISNAVMRIKKQINDKKLVNLQLGK